MATLVVYESMYGNTAKVARSIGAALSEHTPVEVRSIDEIDVLPADLEVLIVGGPTYARGVEATMKAFLDGFADHALEGVAAAAFDTRVNWPKLLSGAASKGIHQRLERKGARMIADPESFVVEDKDGPLLAGEQDRAEAWGRELASLIAPAARR